MMVFFKDMLIDTPYALLDIEDRGHREDPSISECTYCRRTGTVVMHDSRDVVVVRRWCERSVWAPELSGPADGGRFEWRCPDHPFNGDSSTYIHNAPSHLVPELRGRCEDSTLRSRCSAPTGQRYEGRWLCEEHSLSTVARLRTAERLQAIEEELGEDVTDL